MAPGEREGDEPGDEEMQALNPVAERIGASGGGDVSWVQRLDIESDGGKRRGKPKLPLYQVWPSENMFFCRGLMMTGGSEDCWAPNLCVWTCILVPSGLFFTCVFPSLWHRGAYALPIAVLVVFLMTAGLLLATCCTDPGIIPRREVILATRCGPELQAALGYDVLGGAGDGKEPQLDSKLKSQGYRWCRTCRIVRPPRASHCSDCDNCVLRYDHHCPFVNNCVGQRNYHFFFGFITSVLILSMLVIPAVLTYFSALNSEMMLNQMSKLSAAMHVVFYGLAFCGFLVIVATLLSLVLWGYHVYLITSGKTTKEFRKSIPNVTEEPTLCAARGPCLFDPWVQVDPDDMVRPRDHGRKSRSHF